jgi:aminoglycoside/choline kinase family phosphotransferase
VTGVPFGSISPVLREFLIRQGVDDADLSLAGIAGSRRAYYRVIPRGGPSSSRTFILLVSPEDDADFGRFLRITQFYRMLQVPVPQVHCIDDAAHQVLLEDLGSTRLYDALQADRPTGLEAYRRALDVLADLQTRCQPFHSECPDISSRLFDASQLLWETSYYRENYLEGYRGAASALELQPVFDELAERVNDHPRTIMHRDFQSQNLMLAADGAVHVIDYQGSRMGSRAYDLASLLLDPYVMLDDGEIEALLRYFHALRGGDSSFQELRTEFLEAGMQRVMQALGAYCFLSRVKGIEEFAAHIPRGETRLRRLIAASRRPEWAGLLPS